MEYPTYILGKAVFYSLDKLIFITYRSSATKRYKILTMGSGLLQEFLCANIAQ